MSISSYKMMLLLEEYETHYAKAASAGHWTKDTYEGLKIKADKVKTALEFEKKLLIEKERIGIEDQIFEEVEEQIFDIKARFVDSLEQLGHFVEAETTLHNAYADLRLKMGEFTTDIKEQKLLRDLELDDIRKELNQVRNTFPKTNQIDEFLIVFGQWISYIRPYLKNLGTRVKSRLGLFTISFLGTILTFKLVLIFPKLISYLILGLVIGAVFFIFDPKRRYYRPAYMLVLALISNIAIRTVKIELDSETFGLTRVLVEVLSGDLGGPTSFICLTILALGLFVLDFFTRPPS